MERNPTYSLMETNRGELDLLRSITPKTRAYVVEGNRIVREVTEEILGGKRDTYYPFGEEQIYNLSLSEAFAYVSARGSYRKSEEINDKRYRIPQHSGIDLTKQRQDLIGLINNARSQLQINGN